LFATLHVLADTEIKGNPIELAQYLSGIPKTVKIMGEAEVRVPADKAIVSLKVSTENKALHEALRSNQEVRSSSGPSWRSRVFLRSVCRLRDSVN
jgi:uncharacterized protein YggE